MASLYRRFESYERMFVESGKAFRTEKRIVARVDNQCRRFNGVEKSYGTAPAVVVGRVLESMQRSRVSIVKLNKRPNPGEMRHIKALHEPGFSHDFVFQASQETLGVNQVFGPRDLLATGSKLHGHRKGHGPMNGNSI